MRTLNPQEVRKKLEPLADHVEHALADLFGRETIFVLVIGVREGRRMQQHTFSTVDDGASFLATALRVMLKQQEESRQ